MGSDQREDNAKKRNIAKRNITIQLYSRSQPRPLPGTYNDTKFRSQLELSFVKALDARQIRWYYEPERLCRYLVDFYLPDCKCWVEVKGQVDSRDHLLLREVAQYLKEQRKHRLFMYMRSKAFLVSADGFRSVTHEAFWGYLTARSE